MCFPLLLFKKNTTYFFVSENQTISPSSFSIFFLFLLSVENLSEDKEPGTTVRAILQVAHPLWYTYQRLKDRRTHKVGV